MGHVGDGEELLLNGRTNHPLCWAAFPVAEGGSLWWAGTKRVDWDDVSFFGCVAAAGRWRENFKNRNNRYTQNIGVVTICFAFQGTVQ